jgi:hypothetical protein
MTDDDVTWLVDDLDDVVAEDDIGLYEFIWALHTPYPDRPLAELVPIARAALARLRERYPDLRLVRKVWNGNRDGVATDWAEADSDLAWDDIPESGVYLAVTRG